MNPTTTTARLLSAVAAVFVSVVLLQGVSSLADTPAEVRLAATAQPRA